MSDIPLWSVMIPTYNPQPKYLKTAIDSVFIQDQGQEQMQIAVVDDCSTEVNIRALLDEWDYLGRVEYYRNEENLGIAGGWNKCIELSKGQWIHILHQDDYLRPKFYEKLRHGLANNDNIGAAYCRSIYVDEDANWKSITQMHQNKSGINQEYLDSIFDWQIVPSAFIVKREVYEEVGEYDERLEYNLDREMYVRIAMSYNLWYEKEPLQFYRINKFSKTFSLKKIDRITDGFRALEIVSNHAGADRIKNQIEKERYNLYAGTVKFWYQSFREKKNDESEFRSLMKEKVPMKVLVKRILKEWIVNVTKVR